MPRKLIFMLLAVALLATTLAAQEQTGGIEGTIEDAEGAVLPGVTIEATSTAIGTVVSTTDATGSYRLPRLPSGVYTVKASLEGYKPAEAKGIDLKLGQLLTVNMTLEVGSFEETIVVTGEGAQIDVTQSSTATSIAREQLDYISRGQDFTSIAAQAAGASNEPFLAGISIDGASGAENRFVIDGTDTTDPQTGQSAQMLKADFLEELQVKSAGYAAEYGGSTGGVISAVTKTGTNVLEGSIGGYYSSDSLQGSARPTAQRDATGKTIEYVTYDKDSFDRLDPSLSLGGPIARDRLWYFAAYQPALIETDRTVQFENGPTQTFDRKQTIQFFSGNLKGNLGSKLLFKLAANLSPSTNENLLPGKEGFDDPSADFENRSKFTSDSYSAYADYIATSNFFVSGRLGYFTTDQKDEGFYDQPNFRFFGASMSVFPEIPASLVRRSGSVSAGVLSNFITEKDNYERQAASLDASYFLQAGGQHSFKAGVQYETITNDVYTGEIAPRITMQWNRARPTASGNVRGKYGYVEYRQFLTTGDIESKLTGLFLQDSWSISPRFTLNLGVRTEKEEIPNYNPLYGKLGIKFDFEDKLAPRLGFAWDVRGDQKWKVYGSYGTYYDNLKTEMPRGSFGGDKWISHFYGIENYDWTTWSCTSLERINDPNAPPPQCTVGPWLLSTDFRHPSSDPANGPADGFVDPALEPMESQEYQLGIDRQLTSTSVLGLRLVSKHLVRTIEDIGAFVENEHGGFDEAYIIGNPGQGAARLTVPGGPAFPEAVRDYRALELTYDRRMANDWSLRASYTYSELTGNYSGLASSDEFGRSSPNVNRFFDLPHMPFDQNGRAVEGNLATDRPHVLEGHLTYRAPWGTVFGLSQYLGSGTPVSTKVQFLSASAFFNAFGRGDLGRTDTLTETGLAITHDFGIGERRLRVSLNVSNLFDEQAVVQVGDELFDGFWVDGPDSEEEFFAHSWDVNASSSPRHPFYRQPIAYQAPRQARLGLIFLF